MLIDNTNSSNADLLIGAIELAMLDRLRVKYVDSKELLTLYVVDFTHLAHIHCVPPLHIDLVETTGLLASQEKRPSSRTGAVPPHADHTLMRRLAKEHPNELGLTEVLSRYLFDKRWSRDLPKLMLTTQVGEASDLEDGIRSGVMREWQEAQTSVSSVADGLEKIAKAHPGNIRAFVDAAIEHAEDTLPALYGTYSQTRRHLRFSDIKPAAVSKPQDRPVMFANAVTELQQYLDEVDLPGAGDAATRFDEIVSHWRSAIRTIYPDDEEARLARRESDVKTLALLEFLNLRLAEDKKNCRLVFLTSHTALFEAAGLRFGCMTKREMSSRPSYGSFGIRNRSRYSAWLLSDKGGVSAAPILDPRVLMTSRDFVEYAVPSAEQSEKKERVQAITEWLPLFFNGREHDAELLANSYLHLQGLRPTSDGSVLELAQFGETQFSTLISSWNKYIRTISTAYGISKSSSRESIRDLLVSVVQGQPGAVLEEIRLRMARLLSEWLPAVGGATFSQLQVSQNEPSSLAQKAPSRSVPPLIMPAFEKIQTSLISLLGNAAPMANRSNANLDWLAMPTAENLGIDQAWCEGGESRVQYIQALGLAYGFAIEENWSAAFRLAAIAQDTAKLAPKATTDSADIRFLSGREAAFLCSFTMRRRFASMPIELATRPMGDRFVRDLENALRREEPMFLARQWTEKLSAHKIRIQGERLSWDVFRILSVRAVESVRERSRTLSIFDLEKTGIEKALRSTASTAASLCVYFNRIDPDAKGNDRVAYAFAMYYLSRQSWLALLQLQLFEKTSSDKSTEERTQSLVELLERLESIEPLRPPNCTWTGLELNIAHTASLITKRESFLGSQRESKIDFGSTNEIGLNQPSDEFGLLRISLNQWREQKLAALRLQ